MFLVPIIFLFIISEKNVRLKLSKSVQCKALKKIIKLLPLLVVNRKLDRQYASITKHLIAMQRNLITESFYIRPKK